VRRSERPSLLADQSTEPLVEDFGGHQGEHCSGSIDVSHGSSNSPHNDERVHPYQRGRASITGFRDRAA
jgi:hypothetical protein